MTGLIFFVIPMGIQTVLFPWLIAVELNESAERLGIAQMSTQLPGLVLILFAGLLADRLDKRKMLIAIHILGAIPALGLTLLLSMGYLSFELMICYGVLIGTVMAFAAPPRDGMLNQIAMGKLQQTVTVFMGLSFGAQIVGFLAAGTAEHAGPMPILLLQSALMLCGGFAVYNLLPAPAEKEHTRGSSKGDISAGLRVVLGSESMRSVAFLLFFMSLFFGGTFMVLNPIIVRDIYGGGATEISLSFAAFMLGTVATTATLVMMGGLKNPGRGLLFALTFGGLTLSITALKLPFVGYLCVLFTWGISGGIAMSMGRTIMQEAAPEQYRARVMSIFSLANMGGAPIGALLMGYCAVWFGPLQSILVAVAGVWIGGFYIFLTTGLGRKPDTAIDDRNLTDH
jgi:MFS family permease